MEWVLRSPQIHSTFSNLGYAYTDGYHVNESCNAALQEILHNISKEDKYLRAYRRNIGCGQNIKKDLIPLLINAKEDKTVELLIEIFVNLTTPTECLVNVEDISKSDFGRHAVFEINKLLTGTKAALTDHRSTKVIIEFLKKNSESEQNTKLSVDQCRKISNTLLLLRNILHIPDDVNTVNPNYDGPIHTVQNQILWNLFSQSIDKVLINLMTISDSGRWGVTMVQLVALLYKDQHVTTLHKLLNDWLETSFTESSEDNESNTSPPNRKSEGSSPILTSDPTSDSSDMVGTGKGNVESDPANNASETNKSSSGENREQLTCSSQAADKIVSMDYSNDGDVTNKNDNVKCNQIKSLESNITETTSQSHSDNYENKKTAAENSDCGYGTQIENQESISTSCNEDDLLSKTPLNSKQKTNNPPRVNTPNVQDRKRKRIILRTKSNIINVQGLSHSLPTDDDISNVLKEFTVDFLLKGFNSLVKTLHDEILFNQQLEIDTSHFFWLLSYFLKFGTQIELDLDHVSSVLSFDIVSYLTAEGVNICEQLDLAIKLDENNLKPCIRRQHLVVTAIREFVQAIEIYSKSSYMSVENQKTLKDLQMKMCETEELRSLLVLFLRNYNPDYHSKQYLQDLIVTNHILLIFLDGIMKLPEYKGTTGMVDHIKQFANPITMYQYGLLLENYEENGEFVNDCVFTVMHHVSGELGSLISLFQPSILKTFTAIWKSKFEVCDDWSDLVEYVINTFVKKPHTLHSLRTFRMKSECFEDDDMLIEIDVPVAPAAEKSKQDTRGVKNKSSSSKKSTNERWSEDELSSLSWNFMQCNTLPDVIGGIVKLFKEDGIRKSRISVIRELLRQFLITNIEYDKFMTMESETEETNAFQGRKKRRDFDIGKLCRQIAEDDKSKYLTWVQTVLLEICYVKIYLEKKAVEIVSDTSKDAQAECDVEKTEKSSLPAMSPVSYHSLIFNQSVPLVPWNCEQATICKDLKFLQLLHKLGFHMPVDTGKVFIRIPQFWTPDLLYEAAAKIGPIDTAQLKFSPSDITERKYDFNMDLTKDIEMNTGPDDFYRIHQQIHLAAAVNYTSGPGSSFNSSINENNKSNWLELVQRAREYNLNLNLHGTIDNDDDGDVVMTAASEMMASDVMSSRGVRLCDMSHPDAMLSLPTIMSVTQDASYIGPIDLDCNTSLCDTASVASDLTRMYVSDEEDTDHEYLATRAVHPQPS